MRSPRALRLAVAAFIAGSIAWCALIYAMVTSCTTDNPPGTGTTCGHFGASAFALCVFGVALGAVFCLVILATQEEKLRRKQHEADERARERSR